MELAPNKNNNGDAGEEGRVAGEGKLGAPPDTAVPMHLPTKGGENGTGAAAGSGKARPRVFWMDWCRSQSVFNVVAGHIWWDVKDLAGLADDSNVYLPPWDEQTRIIEYAVDQGTFHTIPMFFLVTGYLTSMGLTVDDRGIKRFLTRRVLRILPPYLAGALLWAFVQSVFRGAPVTVGLFLFSHLWFLWALALIQLACLPFCVMARFVLDRTVPWTQEKKKMFGIMFAVNLVFNVVFAVVMEVLFHLLDDGRGAWLFALPFVSHVPLAFYYLGNLLLRNAVGQDGGEGNSRNGFYADLLHLFGSLLVPLSSFIFLGANDVCPLSICKKYQWVSQNLVYALDLIIVCNLTGFVAGETRPQFQRVMTATKWNELVPILALLVSCFWPHFTYWAPQYIRRTMFLMTYQSTPKPGSLVGYNQSNTDPAMNSGLAPSWAIARMWFWSIMIILFAKGYCNFAFHKKFHVHLTQSGMILYIFHRFYDPSVAAVMYNAGVKEPALLTYVLILITLALCYLTYALIMTNKWTRGLFGVLRV